MQKLTAASIIAKRSHPWKGSDVKDLGNALYQVVLNLYGICTLEEKAPRLKLWGFPSEDTRTRILNIVKRDFATKRTKVLEKAKDAVTQSVRDSAKAAALNATVSIVKPDVLARAKAKVRGQYQEEATLTAMSKAREAARHVADQYRKKIITEEVIPFLGHYVADKLKSEMESKARRAAKSAAKKAMTDYMNSPSVRAGIQAIVRNQTKGVLQAKKQKVKATIKSAAAAVIKQALKNIH